MIKIADIKDLSGKIIESAEFKTVDRLNGNYLIIKFTDDTYIVLDADGVRDYGAYANVGIMDEKTQGWIERLIYKNNHQEED